ncbi:hypothetical protein [Streptomyces coeruleorubidus]|uniref:hypothetical protein n=1 Tax=Streptomyces coeruleorubidus TaxID=116188 RepID=UPI0036C5D55B
MLPGTSTSATVLDSATRDRTRVLLLFSLSGRLHTRDTARGDVRTVPPARRRPARPLAPLLVAAATLIALPPTLRLAFFGVNGMNVDEHRSILGVRAYGTAYALAWLPFATLVLTGYVLLGRIRTRSGSLLPASDDDAVPVPPPRSPSGSRRP